MRQVPEFGGQGFPAIEPNVTGGREACHGERRPVGQPRAVGRFSSRSQADHVADGQRQGFLAVHLKPIRLGHRHRLLFIHGEPGTGQVSRWAGETPVTPQSLPRRSIP